MQFRGEVFAELCWSFTSGKVLHGNGYATETVVSGQISKDLKRRGFKFVGPTIVYTWMQAAGIINDHTSSCFRFRQAAAMRDHQG